MTDAPPPFGVLLKRYRESEGLTQEALAALASLSARGISDLERGVARIPRPVTLGLLGQALQLSGPDRARFEAAAHRLRRASALPHAANTGSVPFVGRVHDLSVLERHLAGEGAPVLFLGGEPGIGKSRLLQEAVRHAEGLGKTVLIGGCHRQGGQESFAPILAALQAYCQRLTPVQRQVDLRGCAWLVRLLPELAAGPIESLPAWIVSSEQERRLMFQAVTRFLTNIAGPAGTLLVLDDLQWAGPDALDLLATLVHSVSDVPLRVLAAYRDAEASPNESLAALLADLAHAGLARHHRLAPLTPVECEQLLQVVLEQSGDIEHDPWQHVVRRTGGVPFFLLSCTQMLRTATDSGYQHEALPWSVAQSVRQRVAALPGVAQEVLGAAAVLGRDVRVALLLSITALPEHSVVTALETACRTRLLEEGENSYRFAHDIIREVVEADLGLARRRVLHLRAAAALEQDAGKPPVELLAYHYARSEAHEQAAHYLEQAGDDDAARMAHASAEGYYREAALRFDQLALSQDAARVAGKLGVVLETSGRWDEALAALEQAAGAYHESGQLEALGRVLGRIGYVHGKRGTVEEGIARLQPLIEHLRAHGELPGLAALYTALTVLFIQGGLYDAARSAGERAVELARRLGDERLQAVAEREYGSALMFVGCIERGPRVLQEAARIAEAAGDLATLCGALGDLSAYYSNRGEFPRARALIERVLALAEQLSNPYRITAALVNCVGIDILTGDWQQARRRCERAITLHHQMGTSWEYPYALGCRGWLKLLEGAWDEAAQDLEQASAIAARFDDLQCLRCSQSRLAERDLLEGRPAVARARLIPLLDRAGMGEEWGVAWLLPILAWAHLELGEINEAERYATQAIGRARAQGLRHSLVESLRMLAIIATRGGAWDAAERSLREGLSLSREIGYPYGEARLLQVYGELHVRTSLAEPARARLEAALAIFQRLGAGKDIERTERLLSIAPALEASPSM